MPRDPKKIPNIVCFDWETSGLDCKKNAVTEFAGIVIDTISLEQIVKYDDLVKPYDDSLIYEKKAMEITGLSKEKCAKDGIPLKELVDNLCTLFEEANKDKNKNFKCILVAHNSPFDIPFLQEVFYRCKVDLSKYVHGYTDPWGNFQPYSDDTIIEAKKIEGPFTDTDTKFNLNAVCTRAGIAMSDSHRALADTEALAELVIYNLSKMRSGGGEMAMVEGKVSTHRAKFEW